MPNPLLDAAHRAADDGFKVIRLKPRSKTPWREGWQREASDDHAQLDEWWASNPRLNPGIAAGPSGIFVLDLDAPKRPGQLHGWDSLQNTMRAHKIPWRETRQNETPNRGMHLIFKAPRGVLLGNSVGTRLGQNVDTRGVGGYIVAEGAVIPAGTYKRFNDAPIAPLPDGLVELLITPEIVRGRSVSFPGYVSREATAYLGTVLGRLEQTPKGGRNSAVLRASYTLGRLCAGGHYERDFLEAVLETTAGRLDDHGDFPPREYIGVIQRGLDEGMKYPRTLMPLPDLSASA